LQAWLEAHVAPARHARDLRLQTFRDHRCRFQQKSMAPRPHVYPCGNSGKSLTMIIVIV
jgi:hypothetical protein